MDRKYSAYPYNYFECTLNMFTYNVDTFTLLADNTFIKITTFTYKQNIRRLFSAGYVDYQFMRSGKFSEVNLTLSL